MEKIFTMSAEEIARAIREGDMTSRQAVDAHISRIEKVNPILNAVIAPRFDEARKEAENADERLKQGTEGLPPLFGVPCTVKDTYALAGLPWAVGVWKRKDKIADTNATVVERLQDAGAVIMGKTNAPEAGMWCETYNTVYGRTNNPYDPGRTVGGSSGGEGSIVGSGASPFGVGSDVGGSIRYPSAFNGVAGHKPSGGLVPGTGHWPVIIGKAATYCAYGPLARRVSDLTYILKIIAGPDGRDPVVEKREFMDPASVDVKKLRVHYFDDNGQARAGGEVKRAIEMAAGAFRSLGCSVEEWRPEGTRHSLEIWFAGMDENEGPSLSELIGDGEAIKLIPETLKFLARTSKVSGPGLFTALLEKPAKMMEGRNRKFREIRDRVREEMDDKLGDDGVIVCPVFPVPAPRHHRIWLKFPGIGFSGLINMLEYPSTIIPVYHREDGIPVAVQVVARRFNDHLTLAAAGCLEEIFGGWKFPENLG